MHHCSGKVHSKFLHIQRQTNENKLHLQMWNGWLHGNATQSMDGGILFRHVAISLCQMRAKCRWKLVTLQLTPFDSRWAQLACDHQCCPSSSLIGIGTYYSTLSYLSCSSTTIHNMLLKPQDGIYTLSLHMFANKGIGAYNEDLAHCDSIIDM